MRLHLLPLLLLGACEFYDFDDGFDDDIDGFPQDRFACDDIDGRFRATDVRFTELADPFGVEDFDRQADFRLDFVDGTTFTSNFVAPNLSPVAIAGGFALDRDEIFLGNQPLIPGTLAGEQRFFCDFDEDDLFLRGEDVGFDFDGDGFFERARFDATLSPTPGI